MMDLVEPPSLLDDRGLNLPEKIPGLKNPWLICAGASGSRGGGKPPTELDGIDPAPFEEAGVNWKLIATGVLATEFAIALVLAALTLLAAGALLVEGVALGVIIFMVGMILGIAIGLATVGALTTISGIDPAPIGYQQMVQLAPARKFALDPAIPAPLIEALANIDMAERLATAEVDLIEHARAAAAADDETWYQTHMERLYRAQVHKGRHLRQAAVALDAWAAGAQELLEQAVIEPKQPLRDRLTPVVTLRPVIRRLGYTDAELNQLLTMSRVPGPLLPVIERHTEAMIDQAGGTGAGLIKVITGKLASIETVDKELFGIED